MPTHQLPPGIHPASSPYTCTTPSLVRGNAPYEVKKHVLDTIFAPAFAKNILLKAVLTEINKESYFNGDGKEKEVWTVVFEMDVEEGRCVSQAVQTRSFGVGTDKRYLRYA